MLRSEGGVSIAETGLDGIALKPTECDVRRVVDLGTTVVTIDYEGRTHVPDRDVLETLVAETDSEIRVTTPVRADGFDPLGDDASATALPADIHRVLVAGHPAYLTAAERARTIAPRLRAARERDPDAWVGTEGIERLALAVGGTQFELLSRTTERDLRALRAAAFDGDVAVYAPLVLSEEENAVLDAVGAYVARRGPVADALPDGARTDRGATDRARTVLAAASRDYALVGSPGAVRERVDALREAGADLVIGYPARGIEEFLG